MPDQSSASTEHALMQEITAPLATLPDDPLPIVADVEFPTALRGYDRLAVDAYVRKTSQLVAELQATRSPDAAIRRALERVGEEVSGILQRAHETAAQITTQSRSEAEDRLEAARQEATQIVASAEGRVRELDAETDRIWAERHRILEDTRMLARELLSLTETADEQFPPEEVAGGDAALSSEMPGSEVAAGEEPADGDLEGEVPDLSSLEEEELDEPDPDVESTAVLPTVEPAAEHGAREDGAPEEGVSEPGTPEGGAPEEGVSEPGTPEGGAPEDGADETRA